MNLRHCTCCKLSSWGANRENKKKIKSLIICRSIRTLVLFPRMNVLSYVHTCIDKPFVLLSDWTNSWWTWGLSFLFFLCLPSYVSLFSSSWLVSELTYIGGVTKVNHCSASVSACFSSTCSAKSNKHCLVCTCIIVEAFSPFLCVWGQDKECVCLHTFRYLWAVYT